MSEHTTFYCFSYILCRWEWFAVHVQTIMNVNDMYACTGNQLILLKSIICSTSLNLYSYYCYYLICQFGNGGCTQKARPVEVLTRSQGSLEAKGEPIRCIAIEISLTADFPEFVLFVL